MNKEAKQIQIATLAGGCFWCIESPYKEIPGVIDSVSGFAGKDEEPATYELVCSGTTKYREAVQVSFDPTVISYEELLNIFWRQIDPTDPGGQFADRGNHYKTAIYAHSEEQRKTAEASKEALEKSGRFGEPIVTEILPFDGFTPVEEKHQDFARKCPLYYDSYKKGSGRAAFLEEHWGA